MKLPGLLMMAKAFLRGARALEAIEGSLARIADSLEGKSPAAPAEVIPSTDSTRHRPLPPDEYLAIEIIERRLSHQLGREPTPEEIAHELDGIEYGKEDLPPPRRERLGL